MDSVVKGSHMSGREERIRHRSSSSRGKRRNPGFTLIELLVVIAVIALLMAILLPVLGRVRKQAKALRCRANLKQWGTTLALYTEDTQGYLPSWLGPALLLLRGSFADDDGQSLSSAHPVRTEGIACCPVAVRTGDYGGFTVSGSTNSGTWRMEGTYGSTVEAWEITGVGPPFRSSYGFNGWLFDSQFDASVPVRRGELGLNIFSVRGRANTPIFLDAARPDDLPRDRDRPPRRELHDGGFGMQNYCVNRHNGYVNGLFLDWSVRRVGLKELWTLKWYAEFDTAGRWTKAGGVQPEDWPQWMRRFKDY
jgi:prepilin-type N-terminal cleavage/methylation domain-containing protein/prepilin-type processing-associated H-X9-DG protein